MKTGWVFDVSAGLRQTLIEGRAFPVGTYYRWGGSWNLVSLSKRSHARRRVVEYVKPEQLPKRLRMEMLVLGVS